MNPGPAAPFGARLKALREAAGFTQEELATIAGLSVHAVSALERGQRRRPHLETVRALAAALDLTGAARDALFGSARAPTAITAADELSGATVPLAPTVLVGRDRDLETLGTWFADPTVRLITLTGPGGAGKTRVALEFARTIAAADRHRVVFVPLAAIQDHVFVAPAIAEALGLSDVSSVDLIKRARLACGDRATLLVVDNFEHVLEAAPMIADLLSSIAPLRIVATSRAPLRVRGEREYAIGPLALDGDVDPSSPADLVRSPAVRLFVERARDVQQDFRVTSANGATVLAICRRLDALPLALELAAPWMKVLDSEELLRRLTNDVLLSSAGTRDLPQRQQTMSATVGWSYQLLGVPEQRAFRRLGVLPGRFPIEAAAAVLAGPADPSAVFDGALGAIAGLIERSLLVRAEAPSSSRPLYRMLETIRAYAAFELRASGEHEDALEGLVRYTVSEARLAAEELIKPRQVEWLDRVRADLETHRAALTWLIDRARAREACDIAWRLRYFWLIRGHASEGLRWYGRILALAVIPADVECRALAGTAVMRYARGELGQARTELVRALKLALDTADLEMIAQAENLSGHVEFGAGNLPAAREHFTHSVEHFRALAVPAGVGNALTGLAVTALALGDIAQAERLLDQATTTLREAGPWFMTWTLYLRAVLAVRDNRPDDAIAIVHEALTLIRELHDKFVFVYTLVPLAAAAVLKGYDAWAARILGARDAVTERSGAIVVDQSLEDLKQRAERQARARLGQDRWMRAFAAGRTTSIDSLLRDISGGV